eukprot:CAMPEP_0198441472 /NCGR_PEP_ID=MMETSP1452-20131203/62772_1 /TAXON_ID=1181717 /ORGANISM="Synchroma pusillum, Strain CCMP3072" /LENGTH=147 /DNA_ID=CAMNT_0044162095 /DNA_START=144 /DNA_END=584 /DNA_ORIENTATION=+
MAPATPLSIPAPPRPLPVQAPLAPPSSLPQPPRAVSPFGCPVRAEPLPAGGALEHHPTAGARPRSRDAAPFLNVPDVTAAHDARRATDDDSAHPKPDAPTAIHRPCPLAGVTLMLFGLNSRDGAVGGQACDRGSTLLPPFHPHLLAT